MADVSELMKLSAEDLEKVKSVISLFHLLGMTDEDIALLPQVLKNWKTIVKNMNAFSEDFVSIKRSLSAGKNSKVDESDDTAEELKSMTGFGSDLEKIKFDNFGGRV